MAALCLLLTPLAMAEPQDKGFWPVSVNWHELTTQEWVGSAENRAAFSFLIVVDAANHEDSTDIMLQFLQAVNSNTIYFWQGSSGGLAIMFAAEDNLYMIGADPTKEDGVFHNGKVTSVPERFTEEDMLLALEDLLVNETIIDFIKVEADDVRQAVDEYIMNVN